MPVSNWSVQVLQELIAQQQKGEALVLDQRLVSALRTVLSDETLDQAMVAEMLSLPSEAYLTEISEVADVEAIHTAREFARKQLADALFEGLWLRYQANRDLSKKTPYVAEAEHFARRALQNIALSYLMLSGKPEVLAATLEQFDACDNMTERLTALAVLVNSPFEEQKAEALASFADHFKDNPLVMDQWFSVQAGSVLPGGLDRVRALMQHPAFNIKNPNKVRALIGAFAGQNLINFHAADGSGYRFLADLVIELNGFNPQIASRQLAPLTRWRKYDDARQALMKGELERIRASGQLSSDVFEVVSKAWLESGLNLAALRADQVHGAEYISIAAVTRGWRFRPYWRLTFFSNATKSKQKKARPERPAPRWGSGSFAPAFIRGHRPPVWLRWHLHAMCSTASNGAARQSPDERLHSAFRRGGWIKIKSKRGELTLDLLWRR